MNTMIHFQKNKTFIQSNTNYLTGDTIDGIFR